MQGNMEHINTRLRKKLNSMEETICEMYTLAALERGVDCTDTRTYLLAKLSDNATELYNLYTAKDGKEQEPEEE